MSFFSKKFFDSSSVTVRFTCEDPAVDEKIVSGAYTGGHVECVTPLLQPPPPPPKPEPVDGEDPAPEDESEPEPEVTSLHWNVSVSLNGQQYSMNSVQFTSYKDPVITDFFPQKAVFNESEEIKLLGACGYACVVTILLSVFFTLFH